MGPNVCSICNYMKATTIYFEKNGDPVCWECALDRLGCGHKESGK